MRIKEGDELGARNANERDAVALFPLQLSELNSLVTLSDVQLVVSTTHLCSPALVKAGDTAFLRAGPLLLYL